MIKDALSNLGGVGVYGIISITLFFLAFVGVLIWAACRKRDWLKTMARLPLEPEEGETSRTNPSTLHSEPRHSHE